MGDRRGFTPEQIIGKLTLAKVLLSKGASTSAVCRKIAVMDATFYRWHKLYGRIQVYVN